MAKYKVNEIFYSIQGEGRHAGRAAIFVRFSGCNLKCPFCDTDFKKYEEMEAIDILNKIQLLSPDCKFIVFTGGEPTLQVDEELTTLLQNYRLLELWNNDSRCFPYSRNDIFRNIKRRCQSSITIQRI